MHKQQEVVLPAAMFGSIQVGENALISPELDQDHAVNATVDAVDALLDTRNGTFGVRLTRPSVDLSITAGQRCTVDFSSTIKAIELAEEAE